MCQNALCLLMSVVIRHDECVKTHYICGIHRKCYTILASLVEGQEVTGGSRNTRYRENYFQAIKQHHIPQPGIHFCASLRNPHTASLTTMWELRQQAYQFQDTQSWKYWKRVE